MYRRRRGLYPEELENALLEALRDGMPAGSAERLGRLLDEHIGSVSRDAIEIETGLSRSQQNTVATFRGSFFTFLGRDYLPALERAILAAAPVPQLGDPGADAEAPALNVLEAAELLVLLTRLLDRRGIASTVVPGIGDAIMRAVGAFGTALAAALDGPAPPDVGRLTRELGKLEILRWLLDVLRTEDYRRAVSTQLQVCARRALRRATATLDRFLAERAADARRATAAVTGEIEDLVTLVLMLLDTEREAAVAEADKPVFPRMESRRGRCLREPRHRAGGADVRRARCARRRRRASRGARPAATPSHDPGVVRQASRRLRLARGGHHPAHDDRAAPRRAGAAHAALGGGVARWRLNARAS